MKHTKLEIDYLSKAEPKYELFKMLIEQNVKKISEKNVLDLAAGHCRYSIICSEMGFEEAVAVDARDERVPASLPKNVEFIKDSIMNVHQHESFDIILVLGILYHLSAAEQMEVLKKCKGSLVIVDTHFCADNEATILENGYRGIHYREGKDIETMMANPKASVTTLMSFWPAYCELLRMFQDAGYSEVQEVIPHHHKNRTFFVLR